MKEIKLAGITWWRYNYGSILQAYALQQEINCIDGINYEILNQYGKKIVSISNLIDKFKTIGFIRTTKRIIWRFGSKKLRDRVNNIQAFINQFLIISIQDYNEKTIADANKLYDGFVCGSDQIWNPTLTPLDSIYWLRFANQDKLKIAYAPSIGVKCVDASTRSTIYSNLKGFTAVSCREKSGTELINEIMNNPICFNATDPTLLLDADSWDKIASDRKYPDKYIFVYMLRGTKEQRKLVEKFAKTVKLPIVTIPILEAEYVNFYDYKFGDYRFWEASPADFISLIKNAEYVFGDSFHCIIFSCIYHKLFYVFPKLSGKVEYGSQISRITDFLDTFNLSDRIIGEKSAVDELMRTTYINWQVVDGVISDRRKASKEYLHRAIFGNLEHKRN